MLSAVALLYGVLTGLGCYRIVFVVLCIAAVLQCKTHQDQLQSNLLKLSTVGRSRARFGPFAVADAAPLPLRESLFWNRTTNMEAAQFER